MIVYGVYVIIVLHRTGESFITKIKSHISVKSVFPFCVQALDEFHAGVAVEPRPGGIGKRAICTDTSLTCQGKERESKRC